MAIHGQVGHLETGLMADASLQDVLTVPPEVSNVQLVASLEHVYCLCESKAALQRIVDPVQQQLHHVRRHVCQQQLAFATCSIHKCLSEQGNQQHRSDASDLAPI